MSEAKGEQAREDGLYELGPLAARIAPRRILEGAVPPCEGFEPEYPFGLMTGSIPSPRKLDAYIVQFVDRSHVRIIAYIDRYGRVFSTSEPFEAPPATQPDLRILQYAETEGAPVESGCVVLYDEMDGERAVAEYTCVKRAYTLYGSWFDFGENATDVLLDEALARAYLALVYRPAASGESVPPFGVTDAFDDLATKEPLFALRGIAEEVEAANADPALTVPGLVRCFARWLADAGIGSERCARFGRDSGNLPLRLIRTTQTADLYYLSGTNQEQAARNRTLIWALEAAINRFSLVNEALGDRASTASFEECAQEDLSQIEGCFAMQVADAEHPLDGCAAEAGEWDVRYEISRAIECLRLPYRVAVEFRTNVEAGVAAFDLVVPGAELMPGNPEAPCGEEDALQSPEGAASCSLGPHGADARAERARRYAERAAIACAAIAFHAGRGIGEVRVTVRSVSDAPSDDGESPARRLGLLNVLGLSTDDERPRFISVRFTRSAFTSDGLFRHAVDPASDPEGFLRLFPSVIGEDGQELLIGSPFVDELVCPAWRNASPETSDRLLSAPARAALGAERVSDLGIHYNGALREIAENLADGIAKASTTTERIRLATEVRDSSFDPLVVQACTRLMVALTEGTVDAEDQNDVVNRFLGDDEFSRALARARTEASAKHGGGAKAAVEVLREAVVASDALGRFADDAETVYRCFDSYASRVLYNVARDEGQFPDDLGKRVALAPDSLYWCCLEALKLLEHSFTDTEEALRFGKRCRILGPMSGAGYLQTARAYMLVGDLDNSARTLNEFLSRAFQQNEIAFAYYQLAYVDWKAGRYQEGAAGYLKAMGMWPTVFVQARLELEELLQESDVPLNPPADADAVLRAAGDQVAPTAWTLDHLLAAAKAAADEGVFPVARGILSAYCQFKSDDVLMGVLRSLAG